MVQWVQQQNQFGKEPEIMKIAIVGPGFIADVHAGELIAMGRKISVVVGRDPQKLAAFRNKWNVEEASLDFDRLLKDDISTVHVCTPPVLHYEMVRKLILAGKHVICEKPLCVGAAQAKELMKLSAENHSVTAVNFNVRYHEACQAFRKKVSLEDFGKILLLHGTYEQEFHCLPAEYTWRYQESSAGPMRAVTEIGSHWIDLARFLTGLEIEAVSAAFGKFAPDRYVKDHVMYEDEKAGSEKILVDSEDAAVAALRFSNGALGSLFLSEITHGRSNYLSMEITGTKKTIRWNSEEPWKLNSAVKAGGTLCETNAFAGGFPNTFSAFFREVYKDIDTGKPSAQPSYPTFRDGYLNAAVCEAIYVSAGNGSEWTMTE